MPNSFRTALLNAISAHSRRSQVISSVDDEWITYSPSGVYIDPRAPGFSGTTARLTDEELVRSYLLLKLVGELAYRASPNVLNVERVYDPVGRPTGKGGRADILVRYPKTRGGACFLFVECKTPSTFDRDLRYIDGQLFRLSLQEQPRPKYLLYYTVDLRDGALLDRCILIDTASFPDFESWDAAGQPITDRIPRKYGRPTRKTFGLVTEESQRHKPLDTTSTPEVFNRLREEIHDVIWGGGGTNNNEVFTYIVKLILCKIYDEQEAVPGQEFEFQRLGDEAEPEHPIALAERMNGLYRRAERAYLALPEASEAPAFDPSRLAPEKLAYVVGRLEGISVTENVHDGDLLGEFFEQIVSQEFTQTRGQFFTPMVLVRFMLALCDASALADQVMRHGRDYLGRPRLPYVIDPSCGSGSFLIEYMRLTTDRLKAADVASDLPGRVQDARMTWVTSGGNAWAKEYIFGIENNHDLGLAAKVNMVLHGDGSMNTWISSGLLPFGKYWVDGRNNILGNAGIHDEEVYPAEVNGQFDLVVSNPPFSLTMSPDEKREVETSFSALAGSLSERVFIERWYQLLRPGGIFCCVLPETVLDTTTNEKTRLFLLRFFHVQAIVSLPYDAFRPFTSTKTCIVVARRKSHDEVRAWKAAWDDAAKKNPHALGHELVGLVVEKLKSVSARVFMAEPESIGYKRRKGLPDIEQENQLYGTADGGRDVIGAVGTVLGTYRAGDNMRASSTLGFWTDLGNVAKRANVRLDPKYRWLWDYQKGVGYGEERRTQRIGDFMRLVRLRKVKKGDLDRARPLIDLEHVESREAFAREDLPIVDAIGSDKVSFEGCQLAVSKLEPYLGKFLLRPPEEAVGSTEWVGLRLVEDVPLELVVYALMLPDMCDAYRRLQSGKRHARLDPNELLDLRIQLPARSAMREIQSRLVDGRREILDLRAKIATTRTSMDALFSCNEA